MNGRHLELVEDGTQGAAAKGGHGDDGGFGAGAVEGAVRATVKLDAGEAGGGDGAVVEAAANVIGCEVVDEGLVGVGTAAADIE